MPDPFQLLAGNVALDFANTLDNRHDPGQQVELLASYERLIGFVRRSGIVTAAQARRLLNKTSDEEGRLVLARAIDLREALYLLFLAVVAAERPPAFALETLNRFLADVRPPRTIQWANHTFHWSAADFAASAEAPLAAIAEAAAALLTSPDLAHVRECSSQTCRWLFLDRSKNHTRRWCDMKVCGNRAKARHFYSTRRDAK